MSLSNIIRINKPQFSGKKIITTKNIEIIRTKANAMEQVMNPSDKKQLLQKEIKELQQSYEQLQNQINKEQEKAKVDIQNWWSEKQREAQLESQRLAEEASAQGFQAGYQQGIQQAEADFQQKRQEMQKLMETAYKEKHRIVQQSESFLLSLSVKIAEKVIKGELKQHTDQLLTMVKQALKHVEENEEVVLQVAPEDYPIILPFLDELENYVGSDSELKLIPIPHFTKGGCIIHTVSGSYDVTVSSQLEEIKQHLLAYFEEKTNDESRER